jgi:hypothetical protein
MQQSIPVIMPCKGGEPFIVQEQPKGHLKILSELKNLCEGQRKTKYAPKVIDVLIELLTNRELSYKDCHDLFVVIETT